MEISEYVSAQNWRGSYYELGLELGPCGDDEVAARALGTLWGRPELDGPWLDRAHFRSTTSRVTPSPDHPRLYGSLLLPGGTELGCISHLVRVEGDADWLDLSIPTGMLERSVPVSYPLTRETNPWLATLDDVLVEIGAALFAAVGFRLGTIGEEASGFRTARELRTRDCELGGFLVPDPLWHHLKPHRAPVVVGEGLFHVPYLGRHLAL